MKLILCVLAVLTGVTIVMGVPLLDSCDGLIEEPVHEVQKVVEDLTKEVHSSTHQVQQIVENGVQTVQRQANEVKDTLEHTTSTAEKTTDTVVKRVPQIVHSVGV